MLALLVLAVGCSSPQPTDEKEQTTTTAASSLDYVAFGDSLATGYGVTSSYVYRYADLLEMDMGTEVNVNNLGVNGLTSRELRAAIENNQQAKDAIEHSEVITINIGANDLLQARLKYKAGYCGGVDNQDCFRQTVAGFQANWDAILADVTGLRSSGRAIIRTMDFYNPFVNLDEATDSWLENGVNDFAVFKKYLERVNSHIAESSDAYGIPHARIQEAFNGPNGDEDPNDKGYLYSDGLHPNGTGHDVIAQELRKLGYTREAA